MKRKQLNKKRQIRKNRTRRQIARGSAKRPRLSVFRSARHFYAQLIDDTEGKTVVSASSLELKEKKKKSEIAKAVGLLLAEKALKKNYKAVVFDRGAYRYHGRVKSFAEGAREGGLQF